MTDSSGEAAPKPAPLKPQDAATLIIVERATGEPRVLMGRRRDDQVFMPGKYVFPGGRVDKADRGIVSADELRPLETTKLLIDMKGAPSDSRARALAMAAIRETFEETGIVIGDEVSAPADDIVHETWRDFLVRGYLPRPSALTFFARAITPPGRPRRYDTRFFCCEATAISQRFDISDGELSGVEWVTIEEARALDLPAITRVILEDLLDRLKNGTLDDSAMAVPYYHHKNGSFRRQLLKAGEAFSLE